MSLGQAFGLVTLNLLPSFSSLQATLLSGPSAFQILLYLHSGPCRAPLASLFFLEVYRGPWNIWRGHYLVSLVLVVGSCLWGRPSSLQSENLAPSSLQSFFFQGHLQSVPPLPSGAGWNSAPCGQHRALYTGPTPIVLCSCSLLFQKHLNLVRAIPFSLRHWL